MKRQVVHIGSIAAVGLIGAVILSGSSPSSAVPNRAVLKQVDAARLGFEENRGQAPGAVGFIGAVPGASVYLEPARAALLLPKSKNSAVRLNLDFLGGNRAAKAQRQDVLPGVTSNYFIGNDRSKWITGLAKYESVRYRDVWPGIDVLFYGNGSRLEYDLIVAPGADPAAIHLKFSGDESQRLEKDGSLRLETAAGNVTQNPPDLYQETPAGRQKVAGRAVLGKDGTLRFEMASYDHTKPLIIDPALIYSIPRLLSASAGYGVAADSIGDVFLVGQTIPLQQDNGNFVQEGFLYIVDANGNATSVEFGGKTEPTQANAVALDSSGNIYVTGTTSAADLAAGGFQTTYGGGTSDAFMAEFVNPHSFPVQAVQYGVSFSTYIGGSGTDSGNAIAVDNTGKAYVAGTTCSSNFRVTAGLPYAAGANCTAFAVKIDSTVNSPSSLIYSRVVGGSGPDTGTGIAVDSGGFAFVAGSTSSTNFAPSTSFGFTTSKTSNSNDGFLVALDMTGSYALWLTFIPGSPVSGLALDQNGNAYVTGQTTGNLSPNPENLGFQTVPQGSTDAFLQKYNTIAAGGASFVYSTYIGGGGADTGYAVAADNSGHAYVAGQTSSGNFPVSAFAPVRVSPDNLPDGFVIRVDTGVSGSGSQGFGTTLGGDAGDAVKAVAIDFSGGVYLTGTTPSSNFPGGSGEGGGQGAFATKLLVNPPAKGAIFRAGLWVADINGNYQWDGAPPDRFFSLGQAGDITVTGDWNGDGRQKAGIFRNGLWVLDYNGNGQWDGPAIDKVIDLGTFGDIPVVGDWNGSGHDTVGVFRNGLWILDYNGNFQWDNPSVDRLMSLGQAGDIPIVGDWNGSGTTKGGIFRNGLWLFDYNGNFQWDGPSIDRLMSLGQAGDQPLVGDWNGSGTAKGGFFRNGLWLLDYNGNFQYDGTPTDVVALLGQAGDTAVTGDWNGSGSAKIGIFRNGLWIIDYNGNFQWDNPGIDRLMSLGQEGDTPVAARW